MGTVTSVGLTMPDIFSVSGSPVTSAGTLAVSLATEAANLVFAGPSTGADAAPTFRSLVAADIPNLSAAKITSGTLSPTVGGTGVANNAANTLTFTGNFSLGLTLSANTSVTLPTAGTLATLAGAETLTNKTLTAPIIATISNTGTLTLPTATDTLVGRATTDTLTNKTISGASNTLTVRLASDVSGTLPVANGGTGVTSVTVAPAATSFAGWDANSNLSSNSFIAGYATTATAAGTTTLTVASKQLQYFTGSTTQTVILPVTSTLVTGQSFTVVNNSSGVVTVQSSGGNSLQAMAASTTLIATCISTSGTGTASWSWSYTGGSGGGITGPGSSTDNAIVRWDGTAGTTVQNSAVTIADTSGLVTFSAASGANLIWTTNGAGNIGTSTSAGSPDNIYAKSAIACGTTLAVGTTATFGVQPTLGGGGVPSGTVKSVGDGTGPAGFLSVADGTQATYTALSSTTNCRFVGFRCNTSTASPTAISNGNTLNSLEGYGYDGSNFRRGGTLTFAVDASWTAGSSYPTRFSINLTPSGSNSISEVLRIDNSGQMQITGGSESLPGFSNLTDTNTGVALLGRDVLVLSTAGTSRLDCDANGNVAVNTAAIATNATNGFLYIPSCAGAPSGTPTTKTGLVPMVYDSSNNKFYIYNGAWKSVTLS